MEKKTKIVATISDRHCEVEFIRSLYEAGMNVVRINSAHTSFEGATQIVENTRAVSEKIAILVDTKGPEIRTTRMDDEGIPVLEGDLLTLRGTDDNQQLSTRECVYLNDRDIFNEVPTGVDVLIDDGDIALEVEDKSDGALIARVKNSGTIKGHKSVNIPAVHLHLPALTERDTEYIHWAVRMNLDFIAHSFVRHKDDLLAIQKILDAEHSTIKIISKIENQEGVDNIDEILDHTYAVMVARGDLGVELNAEQIPIVQKNLVQKCIESKKPVIIATQMLHSMINNPRPTRAEVSAVANAIFQRVDAIMLSGETANGRYPVEAVQAMTKIALAIEQEVSPIIDVNMVRINNEITAQLARSAVRACTNLPVKAVLIDTLSGRTGRYLAAFRGEKPVYALCYRKHVMREMALSYGVYAEYAEPAIAHDRFSYQMLMILEQAHKLANDDLVVVVGGSFGAAKGASFMEISKVIHLLNRAMSE
ncbi:MAG: pyruvate kinase [Rikenella sp.]|nr:pyruvate kinase [Rikenella sp.]